MQRSSERVLTTHVGSLARPHDLLEVMREKEHGRPYDPERFTAMVTEAVRDVVRRQAEAGLDVVTDGEQGKVSFLTYVKERLAGFDQVEGETLLPPSWQKEIDDFPEYYHSYMSKYSSAVAPMKVMVCTGPVAYSGQDALATDIANLRDALDEVAPVMLRINAGAYSFEVANPRHQHEWKIWSDLKLPDGKVLLPGLLGHATNYVEHPELIADSIGQYAGIVGRENVIASAD